jgi:HAD superfamily hydrolase (TIGR01509 family)
LPAKGWLCWDIDGVLVDELPWETDWRSGFSPEARGLYRALGEDERWQACLQGEVRAYDLLGLLAKESGLVSDLPDQVLRLWHGREVKLNVPLMALMKEMKNQGWKNAIASNQDKDRAGILRRFLPVEEIVDAWAFSCELGAAKPMKEFYEALREKVALDGAMYVMIDDVVANLKVPNDLGWGTHHYKNLPGLTAYLETL